MNKVNYLPAKFNQEIEGFIELLARSNFSFLQGASHPEEMVEQALKLDYDGIGLCDLNGLYGVARGYQTIRSPSFFTASVNVKEKFRYLIGSELTLTDQSSVALMPMNKSGYSNLCRILTAGKRKASKGFSQISLADLADIKETQQNLLCFAFLPISEEKWLLLHKIFGNRLYIPVWRDLTWESREFFKQALQMENKWGAQLFATNRPLMHVPERKPLFDVLTCILHHKELDQAKDILIQNAERHLKSLAELKELWRDRLDLLEVTLDIANRVEFTLDQIRYRYPSSNLPEKRTPTEHLRELVFEGLKIRQQLSEDIRKTAEHELKVIQQLEYEDYFLTLYEICQFAKSKGILYQGRGSAANSVVCYALQLTAINPVQMGLLFERFISPERQEPPDIDIDFEHSRREEVIQHIYEKYNEQHAAMVCTVIRFRARMAFRESAKVFALPLNTVNTMVKYMGRDGMKRLLEPGVFEKFQLREEQLKLILQMASQLYGFPRHLGIHSGGFIITQDPMIEMVPVEKATMNGRYVIQWNKDDVNFLKLMKIDILSLGMLTVLRKSFELLKTHKNIDYELYTLPQEDKKTFEMACKADTVGVFQIESRAQMNTLPRMKPKCFYDFVIEVALVRPGPLQGGMVHPYLKRRDRKEKVFYAHPDLKPVLEKTLGVPIFQEQVMKIVVAVAGFTPGEADELRRIMSNAWRKKGTMDGVREKIMRGMKNHGIEEQYAEQIYKTIEGFANYGFPESHSASFALLTYASSFLKCHHPDVFACALLNSQPMGFYPPRVIIHDAQKHGVKFKPLDIQVSQMDYTLEKSEPTSRNKENSQGFKVGDWGHEVRTGLRSIYGIPDQYLKQIEEERFTRGAYQSLKDLIRRNTATSQGARSVPKSVLLKLAAAGAFHAFDDNVRKLIWEIESLCLDQNSFLLGSALESFEKETDLQALQEDDSQHLPFESNWDSMRRETLSKGFSIDQHPMQVLRPWVEKCNKQYQKQRFIPFSDAKKLQSMKHRQKVRAVGLVSVTQRPPTAKGMCFVTLEDEFGFMNLVVPPDVYQRDRMVIYSTSFLHVCGLLEKNGPVLNIKAERLHPFLNSQTPYEMSFKSVNTGVSS